MSENNFKFRWTNRNGSQRFPKSESPLHEECTTPAGHGASKLRILARLLTSFYLFQFYYSAQQLTLSLGVTMAPITTALRARLIGAMANSVERRGNWAGPMSRPIQDTDDPLEQPLTCIAVLYRTPTLVSWASTMQTRCSTKGMPVTHGLGTDCLGLTSRPRK